MDAGLFLAADSMHQYAFQRVLLVLEEAVLDTAEKLQCALICVLQLSS